MKATTSRHKQKVQEGKEKRLVKRSEEIKRPKRKVIRVESEETQDYVRESLDCSREVSTKAYVLVRPSVSEKALS